MKEDVRYYEDRAEAELALARRSTHPAAARAHYMLAGFYLDLVYGSPFAPAKPRPQLDQ